MSPSSALAGSAAPGSLTSWFPVVLVVSWILVGTLVWFLCGFPTLLAKFPPADVRRDKRYSFAYGWIPRWSRFEIPRAGFRFELLGEPGRAVEEALRRHGAA